ncbi:hypothetical protein ACQ86O_17040 [Serratia sp. L9]|uniref:hypothetical protein n=1 Tax=Serratia sp. L9 TaxID=3423946 RepID=UPI003D672D20
MKTDKAMDEYIHLRANYWILTGLSGIFMGLFMLSLLQAWGWAYLLSYGSLFTLCAFYALELYFKKRSFELENRHLHE